MQSQLSFAYYIIIKAWQPANSRSYQITIDDHDYQSSRVDIAIADDLLCWQWRFANGSTAKVATVQPGQIAKPL